MIVKNISLYPEHIEVIKQLPYGKFSAFIQDCLENKTLINKFIKKYKRGVKDGRK